MQLYTMFTKNNSVFATFDENVRIKLSIFGAMGIINFKKSNEKQDQATPSVKGYPFNDLHFFKFPFANAELLMLTIGTCRTLVTTVFF